MAKNQRNFTVNDVISMLEEDDDFDSANICTLPPDSTLSDGDSEDEDEGGDLNRLGKGLLQAEATTTLIRRAQKRPIEEEESDSDNDGMDPAPDEPSTSSRKRQRTAVTREWQKGVGTPRQQIQKYFWEDTPEPPFLTSDLSPLEFTELFLDSDIIESLCKSSEEYAILNNRNFTIQPYEMKAFIAVLWLSGYNPLPRRRLYWAQEKDVRNEMVADAIDKDTFENILRNVHVSGTEQGNRGDKFDKLRPLLTHMNEKSLLYFPTQQHLSVDESMVPYYGRHGCKQCIRGKPIRYGYKVWCLATTSGYLVQFEPYQGAGTGRKIDELGMGGSVIVDLLSELPQEPFIVTCDNLFTSLKLVDFMTSKGMGLTGTLRKNRTEKCPLSDVFKKTPRGTYEYCHDKTNGATVCQWNDNSVVIVASNVDTVHPLHTAQRWSAAQRARVPIHQSNMIKAYNKNMGGVDRMDQNIQNYRIAIRMKNWWWPIFAFMLDLVIHQAYLALPVAKLYHNKG